MNERSAQHKSFLPNLTPGSSRHSTNNDKSVKWFALNAILFQLGWFACVLGGDVVAVIATTIILTLHGKYLIQSAREWWLIVGLGVVGFIVDCGLTSVGIFIFDTGNTVLIPIWLLCLWVLFATTLSHSLLWLQYRLPFAVMLGAFAGPFSYFMGSKMAPVSIAEPISLSIFVIGVIWAVIFPLSLLFGRRYVGNE